MVEAEGRYWTTPIYNAAGVIFEKKQPTFVTTNDWTIAVNVDFRDFTTRLEGLNRLLDQAKDVCRDASHLIEVPTCSRDVPFIGNVINNIQKVMGINFKYQASNRVRRGYFDGIGEIFHTLFGTMSASDRVMLEKIITHLKESSSQELDLMYEQASLVNSSLQSVNELFSNLTGNQDYLKTSLNNITTHINELEKGNLFPMELEMKISEMLSLLSMETFDLDIRVNQLIDGMLLLESGVIHPSFLPPGQLLHTLKSVKLASNEQFPFSLDESGLVVLKKIWQISSIKTSLFLIISIKVPIVHRMKYNLMRSIPMPSKYHHDVFFFINPTTPYFLINDEETEFVQITEK